ncbi:MAG: CoA transferase [Dehalococcoidia bacterium]|nr:CoA transferase [Dehalococcoidia bacterium]
MTKALSNLRICDFTGQLAGAGATRHLAAFGAEVIRIEDPVNEGRWDILRGNAPFVDERRGIDLGGAFNNHNVEKKAITLNLRTEKGKQLLTELIAKSDVVSENFSAGVMDRLGFGYEDLTKIKEDIIYVSNSGFGASGPYKPFKTWGPIVQAVSGLTFSSGLPDQQSAGWGYSFMNHTGGYYMCIAILAALIHRRHTGSGQWVDLACTEAAASLTGPAILDWSANGRPMRRNGQPDSNHNDWPRMAPHGIYATHMPDTWIALACRNDEDWTKLRNLIDEPALYDQQFDGLDGRIEKQTELDKHVSRWIQHYDQQALYQLMLDQGIPCAPVRTPQQRVDQDPNTENWGLWPTVKHSQMGQVRVDGLPVHLSETDWYLENGAGCLGEHNEEIYGEILGYNSQQINSFKDQGVI